MYVAYQSLLMFSSILTPGTIFLMIVGSLSLAYPSITLVWSFVANVIPLVIFVLLIFFARTDIQVRL